MSKRNEYKDILEVLHKIGRRASIRNKLTSIMVQTEDRHLSDLLKELVDAYDKSSLNSTVIPLIGSSLKTSKIEQYCKDMVESQTPSWKNLAVQNGWAKKSKKCHA